MLFEFDEIPARRKEEEIFFLSLSRRKKKLLCRVTKGADQCRLLTLQRYYDCRGIPKE
jgi:hypothetical protein